ncbi:MAG TPA: TIGR04283 family arsenosugar biosynthesis glycosyltransferase [Longimicrobium sp.]|jgi:rSAM/selenodomain-associated transferase 2|nr:TIGR04283 family arsenosugar biosynthesis glycosyltransferase [Longimicrobium sp.]
MSTADAPALSRITIIIPTLNEGAGIEAALRPLQPLRERGHQVIVVDGSSRDDTVPIARRLADWVATCAPGRAWQQYLGTTFAGGDVFLFLHADTRLPPDADRLILDGLNASGRGWGRFDVRLSGRHPLLRVVERMMNLRSRMTGIATGDQAIFVRRDWFQRVRGFPKIPLMEDVALSKKLRRLGPPLCLRQPVITSSRRWEQRGIVRTIVLMWRLRAAYALGADPARLAERYR